MATDDTFVQIFHEAYIPRRLEEVDDYEGDFESLRHTKAGSSREGIYYQTIAGTSIMPCDAGLKTLA